MDRAKHLIREYLIDPGGHGYPAERALSAANEMLAVNAETASLLVERASEEIGFAHALFEDFLSAVHVQSWSFQKIAKWVDAEAVNTRWRNVIANVISLSTRRSEVDELIATIEAIPARELDVDSTINRDLLLSEIAFNSSKKSPETVTRLADRAFGIIERGDWQYARGEVLRLALAGIADPVLGNSVEARLRTWAPRREKYSYFVFGKLATWQPAPDLLEALKQGLFDEQRSTQRSAAKALAVVYENNDELRVTLLGMLTSTLDLSVAAATLEALTIGWGSTPELADHHDAARLSKYPVLQYVGVLGRVESGRADDSDRLILSELLSEGRPLDYWDRPLALDLLIRYWPNDAATIEECLKALSENKYASNRLERDSAVTYLLCCSPEHTGIQKWVREELAKEYPFSLMHDNSWGQVAKFAAVSEDIRAQVIHFALSKKGQHFLYQIEDLVVSLKDDKFRDALIESVSTSADRDLYWVVKMLLSGWGRADPNVCDLLDEIASWEDKRLLDLLSLLPQIIIDHATCRVRLLAIGRSDLGPRHDLLALGFVALGCDSTDEEVVDLLLSKVGKGMPAYAGGDTLIAHFPSHPDVRQYALMRLDDHDPPLAVLAGSYEADAEIRSRILEYANVLPLVLRDAIAEVTSAETDNQSMIAGLLKNYDAEVDAELKIKSSINYHEILRRSSDAISEQYLKSLFETLRAVGPDYPERRAAAFAGLLILGQLDRIHSMTEGGGKPMKLHIGSDLGRESQSLLALMAKHWEELMNTYGSELAERLGDFGTDEGGMWDSLAPHISASEAARQDFIAYCEQTPSELGLQSLRRLSQERPSSDLLLDHCWRALQTNNKGKYARHSPWAVHRIRIEISYILRDHFDQREDVRDRLREDAQRTGDSAAIIALVVNNPEDPFLSKLQYTPLQIGQEHGDWVAAIHLGSAQSDADTFVKIVCGMLNRNYHNIWDFQETVNAAAIERLRRDAPAAQQLKEILAQQCTENERASLPRLLAAAGLMDKDLYDRCRYLLQYERKNYPHVRAGYDAIDDSIRAVSQSLLDSISSPVGL